MHDSIGSKNSRESIRVGVVNDNKTSEIVAKQVLIATGGYPTIPAIPGGDLCLTSDGFFEMEYLPKKVAIVGAGYIAVELASVLQHSRERCYTVCTWTGGVEVVRQHGARLH